MDVTVVITHHDEPIDELQRAVDSVLNQTLQPLELLVIDDGSRTPPKLAADTKAKVVSITNRGLPAARNTGLMLAKGEAFLPLDADDWLDPSYLEKTIPLLERGADVVQVCLQEHGPERKGTYTPGYDRPLNTIDVDALWKTNLFFYCALMRTSLLREVGGYHPAMAGWPGVSGGYEDWDLWITLMDKGARFVYVNEVLFHYNTSNPNSMLKQAERNRGALLGEMWRHHGRR